MKAIGILVLLFCACATTYKVSTDPAKSDIPFEEFQEDVVGNATITTTETEFFGYLHEVRRDAIIVKPEGSDLYKSIPLDDVSSVKYKDRFLGMLEWIPVGALAGGLIGSATTDESALKGSGPGFGAFFGTIIGAPAGLIAGLIIGHTYEYKLVKETP